jgi:hypothetical protein
VTNDKLLDARGAVTHAAAYLVEIYGDTVSDVLLEEIEKTDSLTGSWWRVTLSFLRTNAPDGGFVMYTSKPRLYKVLEVDAATGNIRSMKIRDLGRDAHSS